ncbi:MAG: hypothetical protein QOF48_404 [Verrucomicrobiota bacterium]|jgi:LysM repeat protein
MLLRVLRGGWAGLFCLCLCGCPQPAENQTDEQKNPHYIAGKEKLAALDYKGAVASFERATEDNPRSALAHFELGVLYETRENDYAAALYHYNKALKLRPAGYPADNIHQRIPGCKQELVKADSLEIVHPAMLRETARLREENQAMRKQIETLMAQLASRPGPAGNTGGTIATPAGARAAPGGSASGPLGAGTPARPVAGGTTRLTQLPPVNHTNSPSGTSTARPRVHAVKQNETPAGIARSYGVRLDALLAANPGLDPRKLKVGQVLNLPPP